MRIKFLFIFLFVFLPVMALAQLDPTPPIDLSPYRSYFTLPDPGVAVPTVIEIPLERADFNYRDFLILDSANNEPQPYAIKYPVTQPEITWQGQKSFAVRDDQPQQATITLQTSPIVSATGITIALDQYVALPSGIEIRAGNGNATEIVVAKTRLTGSTIRFPLTTADTWQINLTHAQPLKIREINFIEQKETLGPSLSLRFLAQPSRDYKIYFDPDRPTHEATGESGNLLSDRDIKVVSAGPIFPNTLYRIADTDEDGVPDITDNCVMVANSDQIDLNENRRGDACDDFDRDGLINSADNCPNLPNQNQRDEDGDKIGDVCDEEESRLTERLPWLPWAGLTAAALVVIALFALTARGTWGKK